MQGHASCSLVRRPVLWADESPLNDLDEAEHETDELPDEEELIEALEQADQESPATDPARPGPDSL